MKKIWTLALSLVLTAAMFTGCGCTDSSKGNASTPTGMTESMPTILPTTAPTTPSSQATRPTMEETTPTGNGPMEDAATGMTGPSDATNATETMPQSRSGSGMTGNGNGMGSSGNGMGGSGNGMSGGNGMGSSGNSGR